MRMLKGEKLNLDSRYYIKQADELRWGIAREFRAGFLSSYDDGVADRLLSTSYLRDYVDALPHADAKKVLAFNLLVADKAIESLSRTCKDPMDLAYISAAVAERTYYSYIDPTSDLDSKERIETKFLAASKTNGFFLTPPAVAFLMAERLLARSSEEVSVLDPAAGTGSLLAATIMTAVEKKIRLKHVAAVELDSFTAKNLLKILNDLKILLGCDFSTDVKNEDGIDFLSALVLGTRASDRQYDRIIMNPPYGRIRFLRNVLTNSETRVSSSKISLDDQDRLWKEKIGLIAQRVDDIRRKLGFSRKLTEYAKLFTLLCIKLLSKDGQLVVISPSAWLGDDDATEIRKWVIDERLIREVILFREDAKLFPTVNQPTAISVFARTKPPAALDFCVADQNTELSLEKNSIDFSSIEEMDPATKKIPRIPAAELEIYKILKKFPNIGQKNGLVNLRGEIDLTADKHLLTNEKTAKPLFRGDHLERYILRKPKDASRNVFIDPDKFASEASSRPKFLHHCQMRIAGRQCSYLDKKRRLSFAMVPKGTILANSCNYLFVNEDVGRENSEVMQWALLGLLNSIVVEWYFRIFNSNNHVANYEISDFPICFESAPVMTRMARSAKMLSLTYADSSYDGKQATELEDMHDALVAHAFGLSPKQITVIADAIDPNRGPRIANMLERITSGEMPHDIDKSSGWLQHYAPALSDLDREMISHVPQGGNWQDIPESVPSKRVQQIREMSKERGLVRTTYYGRLRPDQPSYTIATYFNRPGNGTNIHPWENRTITAREAARLQSFPDSYVFLGNEGSIRTQIGNAVPPLLAYSIGRHLGNLFGAGTCVDMFAGAGGLSLGLEKAGWDVIAANDHDKNIALTYRFNRPCEDQPRAKSGKTFFLQGDLFDKRVQQQMVSGVKKKLNGRRLDLLVGGPPCQGFSHAGYRKEDDARNNLASVYLKIAEELRPKTFLLENVEGLLTYDGGRVIKDLIRTLEELGYNVEQCPWVLCAEQYGVPQMRRRVFLVANQKTSVNPPPPTFQKCAGRREGKQPAHNLRPDLPYPITVAEALSSLPRLSDIEISNKGERPVRTSYAAWAKGLLATEGLFQD